MDAFSNTDVSKPITHEDLLKAFNDVKNMRPVPHRHLLSPEAYRRVKAGGKACCVSCGALIDGGVQPSSLF